MNNDFIVLIVCILLNWFFYFEVNNDEFDNEKNVVFFVKFNKWIDVLSFVAINNVEKHEFKADFDIVIERFMFEDLLFNK